MANTFLTSQQIAREALIRLHNNMVMAGLVYTDYANQFAKQGDTINVKKPAVFVADDFGGTINLQDIGESSVPVKMDKIADVSVQVSSSELSMNIDNFGTQVLDGATLAISEKVDAALCGLYIDIPYYSGIGGTTPSALTDISNAMLVMNNNKVPMVNRNAVWDPYAQAKLVTIDALSDASKSGSTNALREASMGRIMGFDNFMDQNIKTHTAGAYSALADVTGAGTAGQSTVTLTSAAGTSTAKLVKGDIFTVSGQQFVATADTANAVAGVVTVNVYPAVKTTFSAQSVSFGKSHKASLAFHKNALALVARPMELPMGGANAYIATSPTGLSLRVVMGYDIKTKQNIVSIDLLYGIKTIYPELAARILG